MSKRRINTFKKFLSEDNQLLVTDDERENIAHIWTVIGTGRKFGFIGVSRSEDTSETADSRLEALQEEIIRLKCSYIPFRCGWSYTSEGGSLINRSEKVLFVSGIRLNQLLDLGKTYEQDTVIFGDKDEIRSYQISNGKPDVILDDVEMKLAMCTVLLFPGTFRG